MQFYILAAILALIPGLCMLLCTKLLSKWYPYVTSALIVIVLLLFKYFVFSM